MNEDTGHKDVWAENELFLDEIAGVLAMCDRFPFARVWNCGKGDSGVMVESGCYSHLGRRLGKWRYIELWKYTPAGC